MSYSGKSKYFEIKESIEAQIKNGQFSPGDQLPSEPRLTQIYNASRGTIRQALSALEREGIIARRSGVGTLVVRAPKTASISSFTGQVQAKGKTPSTRILGKEMIPGHEAGGRVGEAFPKCCDEAAPEPVYRITRLRCADEQPVAQQTIYLRAADFGRTLLEEEDFAQSLFQLYDRFHRRPVWADEIIQARKPTEEETRILQMQSLPEADRLVYVRQRITYDNENLPLEVLESVERADFFGSYQYRLMADTPGGSGD